LRKVEECFAWLFKSRLVPSLTAQI
jgi:hypothetical protein